MSFCSDTSSNSASSTGSVSTAPSSPPHHSPPESQDSHSPPHTPSNKPNYKTLESLLLSTITLARSSFTRHSTFGINTPTVHYLSLHARVNKFLSKYRDYDFVRDGTYGYVLEIEILMRLVESALGLGHRGFVGLECEMGEGQRERERLEKKCSRDVEYLVFGGREVDVRRLPWNLEIEVKGGEGGEGGERRE